MVDSQRQRKLQSKVPHLEELPLARRKRKKKIAELERSIEEYSQDKEVPRSYRLLQLN